MPPPAACSEFIPFGENKFLVMGTLRAWSLVWYGLGWPGTLGNKHVNHNTTFFVQASKSSLIVWVIPWIMDMDTLLLVVRLLGSAHAD
jgi:hypothetical protein